VSDKVSRRPEHRSCVVSLTIALVVCLLTLSTAVAAQSVSAAERESLNRQAEAAAAKGLPVAPLTNKIREGLAKGHDATTIEQVIGQMVAQMEIADRLVREVEPSAAGAARENAVTLLAESLGAGVTVDEIRDLQRQAQAPGVASQDVAGAAKGLSYIKEARLPVSDGIAVMAESVRQKFRSYDMLDLGREIKRREADYRSGRASLRALRDAIARGVRPAALLRESRAVIAERPVATRPDATTDRPERPTTTDRPQRPERPADRPAAPAGDRGR
jgi:hypothetical protein